jgi:hypothetical protein
MSFPHRLYIFIMSAIVLFSFGMVFFYGYDYYRLPIDERFFHAAHNLLKPGGNWGHGFGIIGSLCMIFGIALYMARKRMRSLSRIGLLKHWLEFHIFLCTLGPVLILYHTSFKFGGIVAVSFWSMVAVFASGIIGRFIYIQIPRTIEGRELSLSEIRDLKSNIGTILNESYRVDEETYNLIIDSTKTKIQTGGSIFTNYFRNLADDRRTMSRVRSAVKKSNMPPHDRKHIISLVKNDIRLNRRISRLTAMQNLFRYWHVAHLPFAIVMIVIMIIHVAVTIVLGYRWIF